MAGPHASSCLLVSPVNFSSANLKSSQCLAAMRSNKDVWLWTKSKEVMTTSVESGWNTFIFTPETKQLQKEWASVAKIKPLFLSNKKFCNEDNEEVAVLAKISCVEDLRIIESLSSETGILVMSAIDWKIINTENLVASFQNTQTSLYAVAKCAKEAQLFLESLEKGTDGIVIETDDAHEVLELKAYFALQESEKMSLSTAIIQRVEQVGLGERVCVDLCSLLYPGEGLLVGSFARGLFLVHSECLKTKYIASRPFCVNAGPVHAYVATPGGRTSYLSELKTGMQVLVVDTNGFQRSAIVGRVKIETRPLILVEAKMEDDPFSICSLLLQNAETVSLVQASTGTDMDKSSLAISVTNLKVGDKVLLSKQDEARHTGIAVQEFIVEK
ncbi:hypothetical protein KP509_22G055100 [Ceratopteris richardii]|uniref:3-dehydroquinate synthase n=1 Tax=Ceratopteris richardii TaxID=49495 RepID=A0A8T2S5B0_CERRI|nr:hypothetical protein KP509_22G055100 [Ceratopteris richardii]